jgi:hypothetical protein
MPFSRWKGKDRVVGWVWARRFPLVAGALCLAVVSVLVANASVPTPVSAVAFPLRPGTPISRVVPPSPPPLMSKPEHSGWSALVGAGGTFAVPGVAGVSLVVPAVGAAAVRPIAPVSDSAAGVVAPSAGYSPAVASPSAAPAVAPVVAAQVAAMSAAQQVAADALAVANLTQANALTSANLTAANAAASAAKTASTAAVAAERTRLQALADAYAVAHPGG